MALSRDDERPSEATLHPRIGYVAFDSIQGLASNPRAIKRAAISAPYPSFGRRGIKRNDMQFSGSLPGNSREASRTIHARLRR